MPPPPLQNTKTQKQYKFESTHYKTDTYLHYIRMEFNDCVNNLMNIVNVLKRRSCVAPSRASISGQRNPRVLVLYLGVLSLCIGFVFCILKIVLVCIWCFVEAVWEATIIRQAITRAHKRASERVNEGDFKNYGDGEGQPQSHDLWPALSQTAPPPLQNTKKINQYQNPKYITYKTRTQLHYFWMDFSGMLIN